MARRTRLDEPGALHHVMVRGIRGDPIFRDDWDRRDYLERLSRVAAQEGTQVFAWALMPNHVHLVSRSGPRPLARFMQRVGTGYARAFNRRYGRVGYLFQGRYKSIRVDDEPYLKILVRYVHRNPLASGLADPVGLENYPWSGHAALMGRAPDRFGSTSAVLSLFGPEPAIARARLRAWMTDDTIDPNLPPSGDRILVTSPCMHRDAAFDGDSSDAAAALRGLTADRRAAALALRLRWDIGDVIAYVCGELGADPAGVRSGRRSRPESRARSAIAFLAHSQLGIPLNRVATTLGVTGSGLSYALGRGERIAREAGLDLEALESPRTAARAAKDEVET